MVKPIISFSRNPNRKERYGIFIKDDLFPNARAVIYDKEIAKEIAEQMGAEFKE